MARSGIDYDITEVKCFDDGKTYTPCAVPEELSNKIFDWLETEVKNNHQIINIINNNNILKHLEFSEFFHNIQIKVVEFIEQIYIDQNGIYRYISNDQQISSFEQTKLNKIIQKYNPNIKKKNYQSKQDIQITTSLQQVQDYINQYYCDQNGNYRKIKTDEIASNQDIDTLKELIKKGYTLQQKIYNDQIQQQVQIKLGDQNHKIDDIILKVKEQQAKQTNIQLLSTVNKQQQNINIEQFIFQLQNKINEKTDQIESLQRIVRQQNELINQLYDKINKIPELQDEIRLQNNIIKNLQDNFNYQNIILAQSLKEYKEQTDKRMDQILNQQNNQ